MDNSKPSLTSTSQPPADHRIHQVCLPVSRMPGMLGNGRPMAIWSAVLMILMLFSCRFAPQEQPVVTDEAIGTLPETTEQYHDPAEELPVYDPSLSGSDDDAATAHTVIPRGFGYVHDVIEDAIYDIRYHGSDNFVGVPVDGYLEPVAILTLETLEALKQVADDLRREGYGIMVFDGYRPQKAVDHFVRWAREVNDTITKRKYYPDVDKALLFSLGYIASRSSHTRGSTVDLGLYDLETGQLVDMGSDFDFFGPLSAHDSNLIEPRQLANRNFLRRIMVNHGFIPYPEEWWHYTLHNEPYPEKYFDFDVF